jgi:hypothetical protein
MWWCIPVTPELRRLRQEDHEVEASLLCISSLRLVWTLSYTVRPGKSWGRGRCKKCYVVKCCKE